MATELQRATGLTTSEFLTQITVRDVRTGHYRFVEEAIEYLGVFLGYMSSQLPLSSITKE